MEQLQGYTQIGNIFNVHGIKGELKMAALSEDVDFLAGLKEVHLQIGSKLSPWKIKKIRPHKEFWLLWLVEVNDRNKAEDLKDTKVFVPDEMIRPLEDGEFFIHEMVGKDVFSTSGDALGAISDYFENGSQMVFEVKAKDSGQIDFMFPAVDEILISVEEDRVVIEPIEGLLDLNHKEEKWNNITSLPCSQNFTKGF